MPQSTVPAVSAMGIAAGRAIGRHFDTTFRRLVRGPVATHAPAFMRLVTGEAHPFGNFVILSNAKDLNTARSAIEPLLSCPAPSAVLLPSMEADSQIDALLTTSGFVSHGALPAMAVDIAALQAPALPDGYEFVRVADGVDGDEWSERFAEGYELPLGLARYFSPAMVGADTSADASTQFFAVRKGGAIVATSLCCLADGLAGIYCVSTIPQERRKGLGACATAEALRCAARLGYGVGILQSSEAGYSVYRRMGFADFGGVPIYIRMPS